MNEVLRLMRREPAMVQGWYYVATGAWALVSMGTFELVTGRKREHWLVRTVALLLVVIGGALVSGQRARRVTRELAVVGAGTPVSLAAIDIGYVLRGVLRPIYLGDALLDVAFALRWRTGAEG